MRGVVRAAAYLPSFTDGRLRRPSWDEDDFTLAAAALEMLEDHAAGPSSPRTLHVLGGRVPLELLEGALGPVRRPAPEASGTWPSTLAEAVGGDGNHLLLAVSGGGDGASAAGQAPGTGAVALEIGELASGTPPLLAPDFEATPGSEVAAVFAWGRRQVSAAPDRWLGDWTADPSAGRTRPTGASQNEAPSGRVSEGAYLPGATYREGFASRWRFEADRCAACGAVTFPKRGRCRACGTADRLAAVRLPRQGLKVEALTWIGPGGQPTEFDDQVAATGGYGVALVALADGIRATVALTETEPGSVRVGSLVDTRLRRLYAMEGAWRYGRKGIAARSAAPT